MVVSQPLRTWAVLPVFVLVVALVAVVGSLAAVDAGSEYLALRRPAWAPPQWLFAPAWTVLYVLIAVSGWLAWITRRDPAAFVVYGAQLVLNAAWTPLFFAAGRYGLAFADIAALLLLIVATIVLFARIRRVAALLLVPYLLWVSYAAALNLAIWQLNPAPGHLPATVAAERLGDAVSRNWLATPLEPRPFRAPLAKDKKVRAAHGARAGAWPDSSNGARPM
ncbi:TspO/MBR family protein [Nonomuraea sp. NPDC050790]|uniref:TspO/MBR family protein n=1 Tax=Nonomuraea sp. NPDC050790 TaxID=3364371 RepID=UPI0037BBCDE4